ncbi:MAG: anti-anti-sigma regulatory factor [Noviherbaspirillum sp.]|jgi:phospholipid transport system transporter-binding protein|nr:anti-anti-sigma regulatory factor [Noviherbaspirillum sp.]MDB5794899.1 anti-anti-sigma regulatory factor [Noviherbaspirillum sp.]
MFRPGPTLTVNNAKSVHESGLNAIRSGETQFDLSGVTVVDSAAVATLLAWRRASQQFGKQLDYLAAPANLQALAKLYGVTELLHLAEPARHQAAPAHQ